MDQSGKAQLNAQAAMNLEQLGLQYNPFLHLEASADPHLASYLIDHPGSALVWDEKPAILLAPPGGGKTAFRISAMRTSWIGYGNEHSFPIPFLLSKLYSPAQQQIQIAQSAARVLLIALAAQPELLTDVHATGQLTIARFLASALPRPINTYMRLFASNAPLSTITRHLDYRYHIPERPTAPDNRAIMGILRLETRRPLELADMFIVMQDILRDVLGFRSISLHIDGVDGDAAASVSTADMYNIISWSLEQASVWQQDSIILKAYLPDELTPYLSSSDLRQYQVLWNEELLAKVVRHRIYQASAGAFGSFDAIASRGLANIEHQLAEQVAPLPREMIFIAQLVLNMLIHHSNQQETRITRLMLDSALNIYQASRYTAV